MVEEFAQACVFLLESAAQIGTVQLVPQWREHGFFFGEMLFQIDEMLGNVVAVVGFRRAQNPHAQSQRVVVFLGKFNQQRMAFHFFTLLSGL